MAAGITSWPRTSVIGHPELAGAQAPDDAVLGRTGWCAWSGRCAGRRHRTGHRCRRAEGSPAASSSRLPLAPVRRPASSQARSTLRSTLPKSLYGISSTIDQLLGDLEGGDAPAAELPQLPGWSAAPGRRRRRRPGCPISASGTPTTATSRTAGWVLDHGLHLRRGELLAAPVDGVGQAARRVEVAVLVRRHHVAGAEPTGWDRRRHRPGRPVSRCSRS